MRKVALFLLGASGAALAGCDANTARAPAPAPVGDSLRRAPNGLTHLGTKVGAAEAAGFRKDGAAYASERATHRTRVEADGAWSFQPVSPKTRAHDRVEGARLVFSPARVEHGSVALPLKLVRSGADSSEVAIDRGLAVEHITQRQDGIEHSWTFAAKPSAATADLVVRVPVAGYELVRANQQGVTLRDPVSKLRARYGAATWIDAAGVRTGVASRFEGGAVVMSVPAALVESSRYPAVLDPIVTATTELDNPIVAANAIVDSVAYDSVHDQYLVVWENFGLFAQRVTYAGDNNTPVLVGAEIQVASDPTGGAGPFLMGSWVVFDGTNYQLVWAGNGGTVNGLFARRITSGGAFVEGAAVTLDATSSFHPGLARNGAGMELIAYGKSNQIFYQQIAAGAAVGAPVQVSGNGFWPAIGSDGTGFLVTYDDVAIDPHGPVLANIITNTAGTLSVGAQFNVTSFGLNSAIGFGAGGYLVAWEDQRMGPGTPQVYAKFLTGGALSAEFAISALGAGHTSLEPSVAFDGGHFLVGYQVDNAGDIIQVTSSATIPPPMTAPLVLVGNSANAEPIASDGTRGRSLYATSTFDGMGNLEAFAGGFQSGINGARCGTNADCDGGICASGVCCNVACNGGCQSCSTGTCSTLAVGSTGTGCGTYLCQGGPTCPSSCTSNPQCSGVPCIGNLCALAADGAACTSNADCLNSNCILADPQGPGFGTCCHTACAGGCQTCSSGTCTTVAGPAPVGNRICLGDPGCTATCTGVSVNCVFPAAGTVCGPQSCTGTTQHNAATCNAIGNCLPGTTVACVPFVCGATACKTSCALDTDCIGTDYCNAGLCAAKVGNGTVCVTGNQCTSGFCVGGSCCGVAACPADTACIANSCRTGACVAINRAACGTASCELAAAACAATDTDGDGLSDAWETNGYIDLNCNGAQDPSDVSLTTAGAVSSTTPDIFVRYDWMQFAGSGAACTTTANCTALGPTHVDETCVGNVCTGDNHDPEAVAPNALAAVTAQFAARGITLHIIRGQARSHSHVTSYRTPQAACEGATVAPGTLGQYAVNFYDIKAAAPNPFPTTLNRVYHYVLFAHNSSCDNDADCAACPIALNPDNSAKTAPPANGQTGIAEISGNDAIVSLGTLLQSLTCADDKKFVLAGTFMHELGHNLGLRHGGGVDPTPCVADADCSALGPDHTGEVCRVWKTESSCVLSTDCSVGEVCAAGTCTARGCVHTCGSTANCAALGPQHLVEVCQSGLCLDSQAEDSPGYKPNYLSVMNYRYQNGGIPMGPSPGTACPGVPAPRRLDYSVQTLPTGGNTPYRLDETQLSEPAGLGSGNGDYFTFVDGSCIPRRAPANGPVDWDGNGDTLGASVSADLNPQEDLSRSCGDVTNEVMLGHADWGWSPGRSMFTYRFQCTPFFADGSGPLTGYSQREITVAQAQNSGTLLTERSVTIQVRRGCGTKWIAPTSSLTVPVTIFGAVDLKVSDIVTTSLRLDHATIVTTSISDVNGDGYPDMTAQFIMSHLLLKPTATAVHLSGQLKNSQLIEGTDTIVQVAGAGPVVTISADASGFSGSLWPPNKQMVSYTLANCVSQTVDHCGTVLSINSIGSITKITSDETAAGSMVINGNSSFHLEADRNGSGDGRVYTVFFNVSECGGGTTAAQCKFEVPHDQHGAAAINSGAHTCVGSCP